MTESSEAPDETPAEIGPCAFCGRAYDPNDPDPLRANPDGWTEIGTADGLRWCCPDCDGEPWRAE